MPGKAQVFSKKVSLARILASLAICTLVFTALVYGFIKQHAQRDLAALISSETKTLELSAFRMEHVFISVSSSIRTHAKMLAVNAFSNNPSLQNKRALADFLSAVLASKPMFQQARFIGVSGHELVRAERIHKGVIVTPDDALQYKGDRYYVKQGLALAEEEIFISPLDLNIENSALVVPFQPVMRLVIAVFDDQGQRQGMLVFNLQGQPLLDIFADTKTYSHSAFLVNSDGHVLSGPGNIQHFGFMLGLPAEFKYCYPGAWQKIDSERRGHVITNQGLFVFETVNPLTYIQLRPWDPEKNPELVQDAYWKAISFIPTRQLPSIAIFFTANTISAYLLGLTVLLSAVLALLSASHKRKILRQKIACQARRFRRIAKALGEGLLVINRQGAITYANPEAEKILGWKKKELITRKCHDVFGTNPDQPEYCPILSVINSGEVFRSQRNIFYRKDGQSIPVDLNAAALIDDVGEEGVVISFRDYSSIKQYQEEIHRLAFHDTLTGLPNRRALEDRLTQALSFAERHNYFIALLFLDLDHFKQVNDLYGHATGDKLLKEVAGRLSNCVRDTDTVVRLGGDEFVILLPELKQPQDAQMVARKILTALSYPLIIDGEDMGVGVSIGISIAKGNSVPAEQLLQKADNAMYQAKNAGRNRFVVAENVAIQAPPDAW